MLARITFCCFICCFFSPAHLSLFIWYLQENCSWHTRTHTHCNKMISHHVSSTVSCQIVTQREIFPTHRAGTVSLASVGVLICKSIPEWSLKPNLSCRMSRHKVSLQWVFLNAPSEWIFYDKLRRQMVLFPVCVIKCVYVFSNCPFWLNCLLHTEQKSHSVFLCICSNLPY